MIFPAAVAGDVLQALPPIRTTPSPAPEPARSSTSASPSTTPDAEALPLPQVAEEEEGQEPATPTSEESRLRPPAECPPAPRKPAWAPQTPAKRKFPSSSAPSAPRAFFPVARDLSAVFRSLPPKKRIRAG
ncbi:predicted GPI-anchored protein 58 [Phragmites australis]|uniref:predicted GPI-anchored protein 58 n=1 Tax=Phragmites australis TaxID=29695 RepID=UPI002D78794E|nr:predicted GPI-anchored protein 58 [Phragmites australis]